MQRIIAIHNRNCTETGIGKDVEESHAAINPRRTPQVKELKRSAQEMGLDKSRDEMESNADEDETL